MHVEADHVVGLIEDHGLTVAPTAWSEAFALRLSSLTPMGMGVNWAGVEHSVAAAGDVARMMWPDVHRVFVCYAPSEPGLVADAAFVAEELDQLCWKSPGHRYLCGLRDDEPDLLKVIAYNGADRLVFAERPHWDVLCRAVQTRIERGHDYRALTDVLVQHAHSLSDDDMVSALTVLMLELRAQDRGEQEDLVVELLDLLTGQCAGGEAVWRSMRPVVG